MVTLLLDSSFRGLAVGLADGHKIIDEISYDAWQRQSELFVPELDRLLKRNQLTRKDVGDVMVSIGPGSYTGVRIALTVAKVTSFALDVPLYAVSSLQILKVEDKPTIVVINARSGRSYVGVYQGSTTLVADCVMTNAEVLEYRQQHPDYLLGGDAAHLGLEAHPVNPLAEMLGLKKSLEPVKEKLGLTPVYLKD
jgi:tRNA threonylcarbamoyladenosine biosynthesis protein TsaB